MNIFSQEIRMSALSMLYWTMGILLFVLLFMFLYPPISKDIAVLESIMNNFPLQLRRALGITTLNLSEVLGYYGFIFEYVLLIGSVYAMALGLAVLSEEVRAQMADFLFSKPVDRSSIFKAKILSVLANLVVQNLLLASIAYMIIKALAEVPFNKQAFILINGSLFQMQLFFIAAGLFLSETLRKIKTVLPIALGVVFFFFVLQMVNQSLNDPKLSYFTPFAYFDLAKIIQTGQYNTSFVIINIVLIAALTIMSYIIYQRKDLPSL